jgi:DNA-binding NarL/FixJ family response regulator
MNPLNKCALIVDDEAIISLLWTAYLEMMALDVCGCAATAEEAIALAEQYWPAVVLMDMRLRGKKDGVDAALAIHESVGSKVIFITGSQEPETMQRISLDHPAAVLIKPVPVHLFQTAVTEALTAVGYA